MALATDMRKSRSINDYPEHLNPFSEDDNHRGIRFWTLSRKSIRKNSFSLNNIKDLRNTWSLKSFMRKNKKGKENAENSNIPIVEGDASPVQFRRALEYGSSPGRSSERYVYGGSVTPLPRSRFQERMRVTAPPTDNGTPNNFTYMSPGRASFSHRACAGAHPLPGLAGSEAGGSRYSVNTLASTNPFDEDDAGAPLPPLRRKKKRAPLPPSLDSSAVSANTTTSINTTTTLETTTTLDKTTTSVEEEDKKKVIAHEEIIDDPSLNIELRIVEETDEIPTPVRNLEKLQLESSSVNEANKINKADETVNTTVDIKSESVKETKNTVEEKPAQNADKKEQTPKIIQGGTITQEKIHTESKVEQVSKVTNSPQKTDVTTTTTPALTKSNHIDVINNNVNKNDKPSSPIEMRTKDFEDLTHPKKKEVVFEKVNIRLYRRNSSLSSDIDKENGNIELTPNNKRSKSLSNNVNVTFSSYGDPLHIDEDKKVKDCNSNEQAPQKLVCKLLNADKPRKLSGDNSISSTEREFIEIDRATRELEQEINKLNSFRYMNDFPITQKVNGNSISMMKSKFENSAKYSPNPIPKPRRSPRAGSVSPVSQPSD